jgi:uncharacterized protein (TIGR02453 family)
MLARVERFEGFADDEAKFFKALAKNQNREWFTKHKHEFEDGWNRPMLLLLAEARAAIDRAYAHCELGEPRVFRIYRDVRFSKDKSPYKTHLAGHLSIQSQSKAQEAPTAIYLHVGHDERLGAAGLYMMDAPALSRFRTAVTDEARGKELQKIMARLEKKGFVTGARETLKKVPKGFDPEHPRADLLKGKGLFVTFPPMPKKVLSSRKVLDWLLPHAKDAAPFVEWLVFATA